MNKHTPGPWSVNEENYEFEVHSGKLSVEAGDYFIAQVDEGLCQEANARLICAAPDLLEALERVLEQPLTGNPSHKRLIEHWEYERSLGNGYAEDQLFALSAIAKAKGEQP